MIIDKCAAISLAAVATLLAGENLMRVNGFRHRALSPWPF